MKRLDAAGIPIAAPHFYKELGEPELLLVCGADFPFAEEFGDAGTSLTRTQTNMQGASHCDFRYRRQKER
jgi:hypothetical protein